MAEQYLRFVEGEVPEGRKTRVVLVVSARHGDLLGEIKWFGRWRQYCFFPHALTVWNPECMEQVRDKIKMLMQNRKDGLEEAAHLSALEIQGRS